MKKLICFLIGIMFILSTPISLKAPTMNCFTIVKEEPLYPYNIQDPILRAFSWYESRFEETAVNPVSGARGMLQILPIMICETNRILLECDFNHSLYTWEDAFDAKKSIEMWYIVQNYHNPEYNTAKACQLWFGLGIQWDGLTWVGYHKGVQDYLSRQNDYI